MCIAILNKSNQLSRKTLKNCWDSNDDGAGIMYVKDKKLELFRQPNLSPDDFNSLYLAYCTAYKQRDKDTPVVLHFRIATHGLTPEFLHPFAVSDTLGFVHNGILSGLGTHEYSDTAELRDLLRELPKSMTKSVAGLLNPRLMFTMLQQFIGVGNKLIFLDNIGDFEIVNEKAGSWDGGNWFSNSSYKERGVRYYGSMAMYGSTYTPKSTFGTAYKSTYDSIYDDESLETDFWNKSFIKEPKAIVEKGYSWEDYDLDAPFVDSTYPCECCGDKEAHVNFEGECVTCLHYIPASVNDVIQKMDSMEKA